MRFRFLLLFSLLSARFLWAQEVTVPERPADFVLDQTGKVTTEERRAAVDLLQPVAEKDGLGIYLVLLNSAAEEPPADVARRLAQGWRVTPDTAVVLTAPDLKPPLLVEVAGVALGGVKEEQIKAMKEAALTESAKAEPGMPAMLATARSLAEQVRKYRTSGQIVELEAAKEEEKEETNHTAAWIAGGALVCLLVALVLMRRGRHHALIFPSTEPRHRFSAPHSGGNDAVVFYGKREN